MRETTQTILYTLLITTGLVSLQLIVACGREGSGQANPQASNQQVTADPNQESLYVEAIADLGPCDAHNKRQLVYVAEDNQFRTCTAKDWQVVELKGKDGKDGKDGLAGSNGKDGKAGQDKTTPNLWKDPINARTWAFGSAVLFSSASCPTGWTFPNYAEADEAWNHGIGLAIQPLGYHGFWIVPASGQDRQAFKTLASDYMGAIYATITACYQDGV